MIKMLRAFFDVTSGWSCFLQQDLSPCSLYASTTHRGLTLSLLTGFLVLFRSSDEQGRRHYSSRSCHTDLPLHHNSRPRCVYKYQSELQRLDEQLQHVLQVLPHYRAIRHCKIRVGCGVASAFGEGELHKMSPVRVWLQSWSRSNLPSPVWAGVGVWMWALSSSMAPPGHRRSGEGSELFTSRSGFLSGGKLLTSLSGRAEMPHPGAGSGIGDDFLLCSICLHQGEMENAAARVPIIAWTPRPEPFPAQTSTG